MERTFVEATNGPAESPWNWGKFLLARFDDQEWSVRSAGYPPGGPLLRQVRWGRDSLIVFDLQTGEGAKFTHGRQPKAELDKHQVWVCPLFSPFLQWLSGQDVSDLSALPPHVHLPDAPLESRGYRRRGPRLLVRWLASRGSWRNIRRSLGRSRRRKRVA